MIQSLSGLNEVELHKVERDRHSNKHTNRLVKKIFWIEFDINIQNKLSKHMLVKLSKWFSFVDKSKKLT